MEGPTSEGLNEEYQHVDRVLEVEEVIYYEKFSSSIATTYYAKLTPRGSLSYLPKLPK